MEGEREEGRGRGGRGEGERGGERGGERCRWGEGWRMRIERRRGAREREEKE